MARVKLIATASLLAACASQTPIVPEGPHIASIETLETVEYPPPPAQQEVVPPQPAAECRWLDGHWEWQGRRWRWTAGEWVVPPSGCYYARAEYRFLKAGELQTKKAGWYPAGPSLASPEALKAACTQPRSCGVTAEPYRPPMSAP